MAGAFSPFRAPSVVIPPPSGPLLVQQKTGTVIDSTLTITMDAPLTAGSALFVCVSYVASTSFISSIVTSPGALGAGTQDNTGVRNIGDDIWFFNTVGDGTETGITIVQSSGLTRMSVWVGEFSGIQPNSMHESANNDNNLASSSVTTGSVSPLSANNLILASFGMVANDYSSGPTGGFTRATPIGSGSVYLEVAYKLQTSADAASTTWTLTAGINWASTISAFGGP